MILQNLILENTQISPQLKLSNFILFPYRSTRNTTPPSSRSSVLDRTLRKHTPHIVYPSASENPCSQAFGLPLIKPLHHRRERYNLFFLPQSDREFLLLVSGSALFHSTSLPPPLHQTLPSDLVEQEYPMSNTLPAYPSYGQ